MKEFLLALIVLFGFTSITKARPVSYPDGWTVMQLNNDERSSLHVHYSPTAKYSVGYKGEYNHNEEWQFHGVQANYLAKRWNMPAAQANIYLKGGAGATYSDYSILDSRTEATGFVGFAADIEDRRFFASYENRAFYAGSIDKFFEQSGRVGIAPYIADYGDFHTWLMLHIEHRPTDADKFVLMPMVRVFKGVHLGEVGVSDQGDLMLNYVLRF